MLGTVDTAMLHQLLSVDPLNLGSTHQYHNHFSIATEHLWSHDIEWHSTKVSRLHCTIEFISWSKRRLIHFCGIFLSSPPDHLKTRKPSRQCLRSSQITIAINVRAHIRFQLEYQKGRHVSTDDLVAESRRSILGVAGEAMSSIRWQGGSNTHGSY
jgi:hypothetical protein